MSDFGKDLAALRRANGQRVHTAAMVQSGALRKATNHLGLREELAQLLQDPNRRDLTDAELRELLHATGLSPAQQVEMVDLFLE